MQVSRTLAALALAPLAAAQTVIYSTEHGLSAVTVTSPSWGTLTTNDFKHQYTSGASNADIEGLAYSTPTSPVLDFALNGAQNAIWYPGKDGKKEWDFVTKGALTCSACDAGIKELTFWQGNRFGYVETPFGDDDGFNCLIGSDSDCIDGYHGLPRGAAYTTCVVDLCNDETDCGRVKQGIGSGPFPLDFNRCATNAKTGDTPAPTQKCICGNTNLDPAKKCGECRSGFSNFPFCNHEDAKWDATVLCSAKGVINADYFLKSEQTTCGATSCGPTQKCCQQKTSAYYNNVEPWSNGRTDWRPKRSAAENHQCVDHHRTCCGSTTCAPGLKCLDAARSTCGNARDTIYAAHGYKACYGGKANDPGAKLNNGTFVDNGATPTDWCGKFETCCEGTCCGAGSFCEKKGTRNKVTETFGSPGSAQNTFGWDIMWRSSTERPVKDKFCTAITGATSPFNAMHGMHIIVLPIFLTFAFALGAVLTLKTGAPAAIKILTLVSFVLCIFNAYHHTWRVAVATSVILFFTASATGSGSKQAWVGVFLVLAQVLLLVIYFDLGFVAAGPYLTGGFSRSSDAGQQQPLGPISQMSAVSSCISEYQYFQHDSETWDYNEDPGPNNLFMFHGYCEPGWLVTMRFFQAVQGVVVMAICFFTSQALFSGASSTSNKVSAEAEVP